ncbi:unnamed protein product, partial [Rotaria sordida]
MSTLLLIVCDCLVLFFFFKALKLSFHLADGAIREVFEETGIHSKFESIIGFRQIHRYPGGHGRSDIYFICRLSTLTDTIDFDRNEVLDCK